MSRLDWRDEQEEIDAQNEACREARIRRRMINGLDGHVRRRSIWHEEERQPTMRDYVAQIEGNEARYVARGLNVEDALEKLIDGEGLGMTGKGLTFVVWAHGYSESNVIRVKPARAYTFERVS